MGSAPHSPERYRPMDTVKQELRIALAERAMKLTRGIFSLSVVVCLLACLRPRSCFRRQSSLACLPACLQNLSVPKQLPLWSRTFPIVSRRLLACLPACLRPRICFRRQSSLACLPACRTRQFLNKCYCGPGFSPSSVVACLLACLPSETLSS